MMQKYFDDISGASIGRVYEFSATGHKMILPVMKCEYLQDFPAVEAGAFNAVTPAHTEMITGFIGGLMIDGVGADEFRITDFTNDGSPILEYRIHGKYHSCPLPPETAKILSADGNFPIYSAQWGKSEPKNGEECWDKITENAEAMAREERKLL